MNVAVICEFNPFHTGHAALLARVKETWRDAVVLCFCSAEFVQRGEPAIIPLAYRAKAAVLCGADAVFAVPAAYSLSPAREYASSVVRLIAATGLADVLAFGSESADLPRLSSIAGALASERFEKALSRHVGTLPYPAAREAAYTELFGKAPELSSPNDILAVEYIRALSGTGVEPAAFPRAAGVSASALRRAVLRGEDVSSFVPEPARGLLKEAVEAGCVRRDELFEKRILPAVADARGAFADVPADFLPRLQNCARRAHTLAEYYELLSVKQYTAARLRRMTLCAALGIRREEWDELPPFLRLVAATKRGASALRTSRFPVLTKPADAPSPDGAAFLDREFRRESFAFSAADRMPSLADRYRYTPFIEKQVTK